MAHATHTSISAPVTAALHATGFLSAGRNGDGGRSGLGLSILVLPFIQLHTGLPAEFLRSDVPLIIELRQHQREVVDFIRGDVVDPMGVRAQHPEEDAQLR